MGSSQAPFNEHVLGGREVAGLFLCALTFEDHVMESVATQPTMLFWVQNEQLLGLRRKPPDIERATSKSLQKDVSGLQEAVGPCCRLHSISLHCHKPMVSLTMILLSALAAAVT